MIKAIIIADIIAYYSKRSMTEVFLGNVAVLQPVRLLRNGPPSWTSSWELYEIFRNGYGLDQLRERLLRKKKIFLITRFKYQMTIMGLPLKQPSTVRIRSGHGKKLKLAAKIRLTKCFFDDFINMAHQCVHTFNIQKKPTLNVVCENGKWRETSSSNLKTIYEWKFLS